MSICKNCINAQTNGGECLEYTMSSGNLTWCTPVFPDTPADQYDEAANLEAIRRPAVHNGKPMCNGYQEV